MTADQIAVLDSEVYMRRITDETTGYAREITLTGWNSHDERQLGRCEIQVGRHKTQSFARFSIWTGENWPILFELPIEVWWTWVPGHNRLIDDNSKHAQSTNKVISELVKQAEIFARTGDV